MVDAVGLEPTMPGAEDLQSSGVTNFPTHPLKSFPYYGLYAPGSVYAPDRSRAKVLSSLQRNCGGARMLCYRRLRYAKHRRRIPLVFGPSLSLGVTPVADVCAR